MERPFQDRVALVTGATGGIGRATALELARRGADVVACDIDSEHGLEVERELKAVTDQSAFLHMDVTDPDSVSRVVDEIDRRMGRLDVLFNNAGIPGSVDTKLHEDTLQAFRRVVEVNLVGMFLVMKHALPLMLRSGGGAVVNTASAAGVRAFPGWGGYCASKFGVIGLTQAASAEYARDGVRVNAICPGPTESALMRTIESAISPDDPASAHDSIAEGHPLGRYADPAEIARVVCFLASDEASYVNGAVWLVDGGQTAV